MGSFYVAVILALWFFFLQTESSLQGMDTSIVVEDEDDSEFCDTENFSELISQLSSFSKIIFVAFVTESKAIPDNNTRLISLDVMCLLKGSKDWLPFKGSDFEVNLLIEMEECGNLIENIRRNIPYYFFLKFDEDLKQYRPVVRGIHNINKTAIEEVKKSCDVAYESMRIIDRRRCPQCEYACKAFPRDAACGSVTKIIDLKSTTISTLLPSTTRKIFQRTSKTTIKAAKLQKVTIITTQKFDKSTTEDDEEINKSTAEMVTKRSSMTIINQDTTPNGSYDFYTKTNLISMLFWVMLVVVHLH